MSRLEEIAQSAANAKTVARLAGEVRSCEEHPLFRLIQSIAGLQPITRLPRVPGLEVLVTLTDETTHADSVMQTASGWVLRKVPLSMVTGWRLPPTPDESAVLRAVMELHRQRSLLGFTEEHDDCHRGGEILEAAMVYVRHAAGEVHAGSRVGPVLEGWTRPGVADPPERSLEKAIALLLAELSRRLRCKLPPPVADAAQKEPQPAAA